MVDGFAICCDITPSVIHTALRRCSWPGHGGGSGSGRFHPAHGAVERAAPVRAAGRAIKQLPPLLGQRCAPAPTPVPGEILAQAGLVGLPYGLVVSHTPGLPAWRGTRERSPPPLGFSYRCFTGVGAAWFTAASYRVRPEDGVCGLAGSTAAALCVTR